ncbi:MAG: substrate-binding domain-containing protein [Treponema sp.]|nr:substrate-binding domain-containing protein [Treponema sp.]
MRKDPLRYLLPASGLFVVGTAGVSLFAPGTVSHAIIGILALAAILCAAAAWLFHIFGGSTSARSLIEEGGRINATLDELSAGLVKLSTGDLAAFVEPPARGESLTAVGLMSRFSPVFADMSRRLAESVVSFDAITDEPSLRLFYVGSDSFEEGRAIGAAIGRALNGKGRVGIIVGDLSSVNYSLRRRGAISILAEKYPSISVVETLEAAESPERTHDAAAALLSRHRGLEAIYVAQGATPPSAAKAVIDAGLKGKALVFGHDLTEETAAMIAEGVIAGTLSQDPYAQGYNPVVLLFNHLAAGWKPVVPRLLTTLETINRDNMESFRNAGSSGRRGRSVGLAQISPSADRTKRPRIAVVLPDTAGFWAPMRQGIMDAKKDLEGFGVEVQLFTPPSEAGSDRSAAVYAPLVEKLGSEGWHGLAVPIFDRALVAVVNRVIRKGITVATLNSEPVSLRETVGSTARHAETLITVAAELAASAEESGQSTVRISSTMGKIGESLRGQTKEVERTGKELGALVESIAKAKDSAGESRAIAGRVAASSKEGFAAVSGMAATVKSLEDASSVAAETIRALTADTARIGSIVSSISDLANQTNILAINASIQAARAGEQGKGFAVIAAEIRKLAEQSNRSAGEITDLISRVGTSVKNAAEATSRGLAKSKENAEHAALSEKSLVDIASAASESEKRMGVIFAAVEEMSSFSRTIEGTMRELMRVNGGSGEAAAEIESATKEMSAQATDVARMAQTLSEMAKAQQVLLSQFRLTRE